MNDYRAILEELIAATDFYYDSLEARGTLADDPALARYHAAYDAAKAVLA